MAVGMIEAVGLVEEYGREARSHGIITVDDVLFVAKVKRKLGCRSATAILSRADRERLMSIGKLIKKWRYEK
jgi:hypothetical protein